MTAGAPDPSFLRAVRLHVLHTAMETARVPSAAETAVALGTGSDEAVDAYRQLADAHVYVLEPGNSSRLRMANPFSAVPTSFRVTAAGRQYFGNCVWDALGIVSLMGGDGQVESSCPDCGDPLMLSVANHHLAVTEGVAHFSVPAARWWEDIIYS